jgi:cell division protein FtsB
MSKFIFKLHPVASVLLLVTSSYIGNSSAQRVDLNALNNRLATTHRNLATTNNNVASNTSSINTLNNGLATTNNHLVITNKAVASNTASINTLGVNLASTNIASNTAGMGFSF